MKRKKWTVTAEVGVQCKRREIVIVYAITEGEAKARALQLIQKHAPEDSVAVIKVVP